MKTFDYKNWTPLPPIKEVSVDPVREFANKVFAFVKEIDDTIRVRVSFEEFYAISCDRLINVSLEGDALGDRLMDNFLQMRFGISINPFLFGMLHEVGHIQTYDEQLDDERAILYYMLQLDFDEERIEEYSYMYFQIPSEFEATSWAVNYYLSHKEQCDNFVKEIGL